MGHCCGLNCPPSNSYVSPNPECLRMWPYLETVSLQMYLVKKEGDPDPVRLVSLHKGEIGPPRHPQREGDAVRQKRMATYQPRRGPERHLLLRPSDRTLPADTLSLHVWPPELWRVSFCGLGPQLVELCYSSGSTNTILLEGCCVGSLRLLLLGSKGQFSSGESLQQPTCSGQTVSSPSLLNPGGISEYPEGSWT